MVGRVISQFLQPNEKKRLARPEGQVSNPVPTSNLLLILKSPELFSSLVALTNDEAANDIGIGTIVGSAIFNILVIIGVTAIFSGRTLQLDYRPLARDAIFYAASIIGVILFFHDGKIHWWGDACGLIRGAWMDVGGKD